MEAANAAQPTCNASDEALATAIKVCADIARDGDADRATKLASLQRTMQGIGCCHVALDLHREFHVDGAFEVNDALYLPAIVERDATLCDERTDTTRDEPWLRTAPALRRLQQMCALAAVPVAAGHGITCMNVLVGTMSCRHVCTFPSSLNIALSAPTPLHTMLMGCRRTDQVREEMMGLVAAAASKLKECTRTIKGSGLVR